MKRQAARWQRQADAGEMPEELYETMAEGAKGIEKRQVVNLAKASNLFDDSGTIRTYNEFKRDWTYEKSIFAHGMATCGLCGKYPIREQCILVDSTRAGENLVVGNTCVERYIEITVDGVALEGEEKAAYLRGNMKEAKHKFQQEKFSMEHPDAMMKLKQYEDWMTSKKFIRGRMRPANPDYAKLHRNMVKRLVSHGYPGPKFWKQWNQFRDTSDAEFQIFQEAEAEKERLRKEALQKQRARAAKLANELAKRRSQYALDAEAFREVVESINNELDDWERSASARAIQTIRTRGRSGLSQGMTRLVKAIEARDAHKRGELVIQDPMLNSLSDWLSKPKFLNAWESKFCKSIRNQIIEGKDLSEKQRAIVDKLTLRWAEK